MELWKRNLYILCITQVLSLMSFGFGLPFLPYFMQDLGVHNENTIKLYSALLNFLPSIAMIIMSPVWGNLSEKYGKKRMIQRAMYCGTIILFLFSLVQTPFQLLGLRFFQGFFTGTIAAASAFVGTYNPKEHLSYSLGLLTSSNAIGYCIGPAIGGYVADLSGYRTSFLVGSIIMLFGATITTLFLKEDNKLVKENYLKRMQEKQNEPKQVEIKEDSNSFFYKLKKILHIQGLSQIDLTFFLLIAFQRMIREMFSAYLALYIATMLTGHMLERVASVTGILNLFMGLASALAGISITKLAYKYKISKITKTLLILATLITLPLFITKQFFIFAILFVILRYILSGIEPLLVSNSSQITEFDNKGLYFGYIAVAQNVGSMLSPLIGSIIALKFDYHYIFIAMTILLIINILINTILYKKIE